LSGHINPVQNGPYFAPNFRENKSLISLRATKSVFSISVCEPFARDKHKEEVFLSLEQACLQTPFQNKSFL
jgi:hypothetical protein